MRILFTTIFFLLAFALLSRADSEITLILDDVPGVGGYKFYISPSGSARIQLCMWTSVAMGTAPMKPTDTYFSNHVPSGPSMLRPVCNIQTFDKNGNPIGKSPFRDISLLETRLDSPASALVLQPGDRLALQDGFYRDKPAYAQIRIVIYDGHHWAEKTLHWKNE